MGEELPEWESRDLLADAVKSCGLPWVPGAVWRRPSDRWMTLADNFRAIALERIVVAEARRRLPAGVSGRVIGQAWRDAAWRCIVAGLALLDAEARSRIGRGFVDEPEPVLGDSCSGATVPALIAYAAAGGGAVGSFESFRRTFVSSAELFEPVLLVVRDEPELVAEASPPPEPEAPVTFTIRRRGEVSRAS